MNNLISQDYLMHHGVKGMKWGVRHDKPSGSSRTRKRNLAKTVAIYAFPPTRYKALYDKHIETKQRNYEQSDYAAAKKMTDAELREKINRINLEQSYISAMQRDRQSAKQASQTVLEQYGEQAISIATGTSKNIALQKVNKAAFKK